MLIRIPGVFDADALARARALLEDAPWTDGATTAGTQALQVKHNQQLPVTCAPAQALQSMVLGALERHPVFFSAALPKRVFPPMFNRYGGAANTYGAHVDHAPVEVLEQNNAMSLFGLHRRLRGAALGHLAAFEATSSPSRYSFIPSDPSVATTWCHSPSL